MKKKFDIENLLKKYWKDENNKYYQKLKQCLEADIRARTKTLKADKFTPLFPDAHRWIKNGQYEQYLLTLDKKAPTFKKPKTTPF